MVNDNPGNVAYCRVTICRDKWHGKCLIYLFCFMESAQNGMAAVLKQTIRPITEAFHAEK